MGGRWKYGLVGAAIGLLIVLAFDAVRRPHDWQPAIIATTAMCLSCGNLAIYVAERKGKVKSIEEICRPLTLFPRTPGASDRS